MTITIQRFANDVLTTLQQHLAPGDVTFRGSFLSGDADEYSDVDLHAQVHQQLDEEFFDSLKACLKERFGRLTVRYDPDYRNDRQAQDLRITLRNFPIFWRIDLVVASDRKTPRKHPAPFPEWSVATSAFWNLVWAVKYSRRGKPEVASDYMAAACDKLQIDRMRFSHNSVQTLLAVLIDTDGVDVELATKLGDEASADPLM